MSEFDAEAPASSAESAKDDSEGYIQHLEEAKNADFADIERCKAITIGRESESGQPIILFIPKLALDANLGEENAVLRRVLLYFIKMTDQVVRESYKLVYCHSSVSVLQQRSLIYQYYQIIPRRYKKNLKSLFVINPQFGIRLFFEFTRVFISKKFYAKLRFCQDIASFQREVPVKDVSLPIQFIRSEDTEKGLVADRSTGIGTLENCYCPEFGSPYFLFRCVSFLRSEGRILKEGLFRLPGDHLVAGMVRARLQHYYRPGSTASSSSIAFHKCQVLIGADDAADTSFVADGVPAICITDVDTVATVMGVA